MQRVRGDGGGKDSDDVLRAGPMTPTHPASSSASGGEGGGKRGGMEGTGEAAKGRAEAEDLSFHGSEYSHDSEEGKKRSTHRHKIFRARSSASSQPRVRLHLQRWKATVNSLAWSLDVGAADFLQRLSMPQSL